jgi:translation initiation factor IF-2
MNRPPVVAIVGHIDHGKSTLLDYIRHTNVVEGEAGGITQHLSAYVAEHQPKEGPMREITFLDTPGHEAFAAMRSRGLEVADVAVLVVSAEEGTKPQTLEALKLINEVKIPYIVAFTKIDKPGANIERAKLSMLEHGVFLEGMGGEVPWVAVSGKTGEGTPELLDLILLAGELEGLSADESAQARGAVIEAHVDPKRGNSATLIVEDGSLESGEYVVSGESFAPVRIMENFLGKKITEALPGHPVQIVGFSALPQVGALWHAVESKKEAEEDVGNAKLHGASKSEGKTWQEAEGEDQKLILPLVIKSDVAGTLDAVMHEIEKIPVDQRMELRVLSRAVGAVSEGDVRLVGSGAVPGLIAGFNVKVEREARDLAQRLGVEVGMFDVIYKLGEWLAEKIEARRPRQRLEEVRGAARIIKVFSSQKNRVVLGGKVEHGALSLGKEVKILRRDAEIGRGTVVSLQSHKKEVKEVDAGSEFGAMIKTDALPAAGDMLEAFEIVIK